MIVNKGLLWKEWKQNWWKCWAVFVLMSMTPIISPALGYIIMRVDPEVGGQFWSFWLETVLKMVTVNPGQTSMGMMAVWVALGLAILLLAQERNQNSLDFLVAMPVSRREIVSAKFLIGMMAITIIMLINLIFIVVLGCLMAVPQLIFPALAWFAVTTAVLLAVFSLAFLAATITGNLVASLVGAIVLVFGPKLLLALLYGLLASFGVFGWGGGGIADLLLELGRNLTVSEYIRTYTYGQTSLAVIPVMLAVGGASFILAMKAFVNNHLERDGQILVVGNSFKITWIVLSLTGAMLVTILAAKSRAFEPGLAGVLVFAGLCLLSTAIFRLRGRWDKA